VFTRHRHRFAYRYTDTVGQAWKEVGDDLRKAIKEEGIRIDEAAERKEARLVTN
jgi:hypothetical protein